MANSNKISKQDSVDKKDKQHESVKAGKQAIDINKKITRQERPEADADTEEKKDAEQWRNEG